MGWYSNGHSIHGDAVVSFLVENGHAIGDNHSKHQGWEIVIGGTELQKGLEIEVSGRRHDLSRIPCIIYNGFEDHHEIFHNPNRSIKALVIPDEFINQRLKGIAEAREFSFRSEPTADSKFANYASSSYDMIRSGVLDDHEIAAVTEGLLLELIDNQPHNKEFAKKELSQSFLNKLLLKEILIQIHENAFSSDFDLDHLSDQLGVSKFHIIRTTKKLCGFTPHSYLLKIRLEKARRLVTETKFFIGQVASECGFDDMSTFNKAFKRKFGKSPAQFRN